MPNQPPDAEPLVCLDAHYAEALMTLGDRVRGGDLEVARWSTQLRDDGTIELTASFALCFELSADRTPAEGSPAAAPDPTNLGHPGPSIKCPECGGVKVSSAGRDARGVDELMCLACGATWPTPPAKGG